MRLKGYPGMIAWLDELFDLPIEMIGGKATGIGCLVHYGFAVPWGFCITTAVLQDFLRLNGLDSDVQEWLDIDLISDEKQLTLRFRQMQVQFKKGRLPEDLVNQIVAAYDRLGSLCGFNKELPVAVRSSCASEDVAGTLSAGQYDSIIGVIGVEQLLQSVKSVWLSLFKPSAILYRTTKDLPAFSTDMAVLVQEMVPAKRAGVAYTIDLDRNDPSVLVIESTAGPAQRVVSGAFDVEGYVVNKRGLQLIRRTRSPNEADALSKKEIGTLSTQCKNIERAFRAPVDIEWVIRPEGDLVYLQARPLPFQPRRPPGEFILEAADTPFQSGKLRPYQIVKDSGLASLPAHVITPSAFQSFKQNNRDFTTDLRSRLASLFESYSSKGPIVVRSAYSSMINSGDMMPESPVTTSVNECLSFVEEFWNTVIRQGLDDYSAEVALIVHNLIEPFAAATATLLVNGFQRTVIIEALYGLLDGLQANIHDVYEVDVSTLRITSKYTPGKPMALFDIRGSPTQTPQSLISRPVLTEEVIVEIARRVVTLTIKLGTQRMEFLITKDKSKYTENDPDIILWQCEPSELTALKTAYYRVEPGLSASTGALIRGHAVRLTNPEQVDSLISRLSYGSIVCIDIGNYRMRDMFLINQLCKILSENDTPVVFKGSILSHIAGTLRDFDITLFPINHPLNDIEEGDLISVITQRTY